WYRAVEANQSHQLANPSWSKLSLVHKVKLSHEYLCVGSRVCSRYSWFHLDRFRSGGAGHAGAGPLGPDPADHHPAAPDGIHSWPDPDPAAECCPGTSVTDRCRADHRLLASSCRRHHSTARYSPCFRTTTIPAASLAEAQIVLTGADTNTTSSGQGAVTVTVPVAGNVVSSGGMVMVVPGAGSVPAIQRIPLPGAEMLREEPLYVNAKHVAKHTLKRRQAWAQLEAEGKIPKERRKYLHESWHHPIMARKHGEGGWFFFPKKEDSPHMQDPNKADEEARHRSFECPNLRPCDGADQGHVPYNRFPLFQGI
uniref:Nuclear transcription factor Y subunit n=1 Tax=Ailuropoda melanoleuca TaxID=9646 RepID=A0A7N5JMW4_AILME